MSRARRFPLLAVAALVVVPLGAGAPGSSSSGPRTLVQGRVRFTALAQDGRYVAWLRPAARHKVGIVNVVSHRRFSLPARRFVSDLGTPETLPSPLALAGERAVYVLYEAQGNTEEHFYVVTTSPHDPRERVLQYALEGNRPYAPGDGPTWIVAADGKTILFQGQDGQLYRAAGRRRILVRRRGLGGVLAVSGSRYASASLSSTGGCICNLEPSWSPDATSIAFASGGQLSTYSGASEPRRILVAPAAGGASRVLARGSSPDWSPDGSLIAYQRVLGTSAVYVIRPDGGRESRLLAGGSPSWSPDGSRIAFVRREPTGQPVVYVAARDGSGERRLYAGASPDWSPDGQRLAFVFNSDIYVASLDGGARQRLTATDFDTVYNDPAWSPDGTRIAYTAVHTDEATGEVDSTAVWVMNADGTGKHPLGLGRKALTPAWSPNGTTLAYGGWLPKPNPATGLPSTEIFAASSEGAGERQVTMATPAEPKSKGFVQSVLRHRPSAALQITGAVSGLALTPRIAAVLARGFFGARIEIFDTQTGHLRREVAVPEGAADSISAARSFVVYSVGKEIRLLDARKGKQATIAVAEARPPALSIEGHRVAWIENLGSGGRIRILTLNHR